MSPGSGQLTIPPLARNSWTMLSLNVLRVSASFMNFSVSFSLTPLSTLVAAKSIPMAPATAARATAARRSSRDARRRLQSSGSGVVRPHQRSAPASPDIRERSRRESPSRRGRHAGRIGTWSAPRSRFRTSPIPASSTCAPRSAGAKASGLAMTTRPHVYVRSRCAHRAVSTRSAAFLMISATGVSVLPIRV